MGNALTKTEADVAYATKGYVDNQIKGVDLTTYAKTTDLAGYAKTSDIQPWTVPGFNGRITFPEGVQLNGPIIHRGITGSGAVSGIEGNFGTVNAGNQLCIDNPSKPGSAERLCLTWDGTTAFLRKGATEIKKF